MLFKKYTAICFEKIINSFKFVLRAQGCTLECDLESTLCVCGGGGGKMNP